MRMMWPVLCVAVVAFALSAKPVGASEGFEDVAKLAKAGVTEDVLLNFVKTSPLAFDLSVDEILYLTDLGVTPKAISAIMDHGKDLRGGKQPDAATETAIDTEKLKALTDKELDEDAADAGAGATTVALTGENNSADTVETPGPLADGEQNDGKRIFATPLSNDILREQESVTETVAAPVPVAAPEEGAVTTATFYESLTPYGTWIRIDDAWCWQPAVTVSDPGWQPYCDRGHWVSTDCGWYWQSDYSWGWAPFHYGRWKRCAGYGWLWSPDTVWSPAWVSWRECDSHYGWAPLPPSCGFDVGLGFSYRGGHFGLDIGFGLGLRDYCFVGAGHFCDFGLRRHRIPRHECVNIYNRTTIVQNNVTVINNRVTVGGPRFDRVQQQSGRNINRLKIADAHFNAGQKLNGTAREDRRNGTLTVYRPQVKAAANNDTPATIAKKQLASHVTQTKVSADSKVLATSQRADEIRNRQLAAQESRRKTAETLQQTRAQNNTIRTAELEQKKLQNALGKEQDTARKAELAAKLDAQKLNAENARKQKVELENKAADQRKRTLELAQQRDASLKAKATAEAAENRAKLEGQRKAQQDNRQAQLDAQRKAQQDALSQRQNENKAKLEAQRLEASQRQAQLESQRKAQQDALSQRQNENKAKLEAQRLEANQRQAQVEAQRKAQQETAQQAKLQAQQNAQLESQRAAQQEARQAQLKAQQEAQQQAQLKAQQEAAGRQAQLQAQRQAQQEAQAARQAQQQAAAAERQAQLQAQRQAQQEAAAARQAQLQAQRDARANQNNSNNNQNDDPFSSRRRR